MMEAALCSCQWEWGLIMGRGGISLCGMTSSGLLRAEAEPSGLRATCVQCFQWQNVFFLFQLNDAEGMRFSERKLAKPGIGLRKQQGEGAQKVMPMGVSSPFLCASSFISLFRPTGGRGSFFPTCQSSTYFHSKHLLSVFCNWSPGFTFEHVWTSLILN